MVGALIFIPGFMNACLENIVTVRDYCSGERTAPTSGYDLMDAPEITVTGLANIATEKYVTGLKLAKETVKRAVTEVSNDFIAVLATNNIGVSVVNPEQYIATFNTATNNLATALERGVIWTRSVRTRSKIRRARISEIQVYPLADVEATFIKIYDNGYIYSYPVTLVGNALNTFNIQHIVQGPNVKVVMDNTSFATATTTLACTCDGTLQDGMGTIAGWNGATSVGREGFGINLKIGYYCDYESLLCDFAKVYVGELIYLKARWMILEEQKKSNRFEHFVIKDRKGLKEDMADLNNRYISKWNVFVQSLFDLLKKYNDVECIECRGIRWITNT